MGLILLPGTCSECGCTDDRACVDDEDGVRCSWADPDRTICSFCAHAQQVDVLGESSFGDEYFDDAEGA
jgi:hypothetical protein